MISLEDELAAIGADPIRLAEERREVFSLFGELRAASYLAVALVTTGVGIVIKNNADRIGPLTIVAALLIAAAERRWSSTRSSTPRLPSTPA